MSRMPPGQGQGPVPAQSYPPPPPPHHQNHNHGQQRQHQHQHQQHQQPPPHQQQQQQQMYYPPPPPSSHGQGGMYPPPPPNEGMYAPPPPPHSFPRSQPPPPPPMQSMPTGPPGSGPGQSQGQAGGGWNDGYGPPAPGSGGSSGRNDNGNLPPPPQMDGYYQSMPGPGPPPGVPGSGWSSVHPSAASKMAPPRSRGGQGDSNVKLEDLVSSDRSRGRPPTGGAAGGLTSAPLGSDGARPPTSAGAGGADAAGVQAGPSEFIKKLYKMLEEESALFGRGKPAGQPRPEGAKRGSVGWGRGGTSFVVWDMNEFTTKVLPQTFRHSNFSSFVRQLNKYGFSKIKHVDDNSGQIKENVWEFTHPNFQTGGKSELDSIKRKAVVPKKGEDGEGSTGRGGIEDPARISEMEGRVSRLEDQLALALDELRQARSREMNLHTWAREMVVHMSQVERESTASPHSSDNSIPPRIMRLHQFLDHAVTPGMMPMMPPAYPSGGMSGVPSASRPYSNMPFMGAGTSQVSPMTDGSGSGGHTGTSPEGSKGSNRPQTRGKDEDIIELPPQQQHLFGDESLHNIPLFADTPAWLTEGTTTAIPIYHRKSSDGVTMKLMMEALAGQNNGNGNGIGMAYGNGSNAGGGGSGVPTRNGSDANSQDPLDNSPRERKPDISNQPSPFGSLVVPVEQGKKGKKGRNTTRMPMRRSTTIVTSWTHAPKILVVEDDVVYRQLSSKFLEKFGCTIETVDSAQQAIERMNHVKYDLVLMDIFFGPSMDGRKATSLIRQFDRYTPIISMTSNAQPQDVDSYLQSGMNDVLAKPFTKSGLFGILEKHLIHLKAIQLSTEIPISLGLPPLSDQGVMDAVIIGAQGWNEDTSNPLASMGWSDETYQLILQQFITNGSMPDISQLNQLGNGSMATNVILGESRKRSIEVIDDDFTSPATSTGRTPQIQQHAQQAGPPGSGPGQGQGQGQRESKRMKGQ